MYKTDTDDLKLGTIYMTNVFNHISILLNRDLFLTVGNINLIIRSLVLMIRNSVLMIRNLALLIKAVEIQILNRIY